MKLTHCNLSCFHSYAVSNFPMKTLTTYLFERVDKNEVFIQKQNNLISLLEKKITLLENKISEEHIQQINRVSMRVASSTME